GSAGDFAFNDRIDDLVNALVRVERNEVMGLHHVVDDRLVFRFGCVSFFPGLKMGLEIHTGRGLGVEGRLIYGFPRDLSRPSNVGTCPDRPVSRGNYAFYVPLTGTS